MKGKMITIERCRMKDPNEFWKQIEQLGPQRKSCIPLEVIVNGQICTDKSTVMKVWKEEFEQLYKIESSDSDDQFKTSLMQNHRKTCDKKYNSELNEPIRFSEVERAVNSLKTKKAAGIDSVPNELLKNDMIKGLLHSLFNLCLRTNLMPSDWKKAIIHPIPKVSGKVINPLKYRGHTLQSCVFKVLCAVINRRLTDHLEQQSNLEDE